MEESSRLRESLVFQILTENNDGFQIHGLTLTLLSGRWRRCGKIREKYTRKKNNK